MADNCRITPYVFNPKGEEVESKLYVDLKNIMSYIGKGSRTVVLPLYQKTLNPEFTKDMKQRGASFDENGEVTLYDFLNFTKEGKEIPESVVIQYLNESNKFSKGREKFAYTKTEALDLVEKFNSSVWNKKYTAKIEVVKKDKYSIGVYPVNEKYRKQSLFTSQLSKRLAKLLEDWGIAVDVYDDLEKQITQNYTNFDDIGILSDGLIHLIKIAKNSVDVALPEEFAHFVIRSMRESPLISRALNQLKQNEGYKAVLGEEYDTYANEYQQDVDLLAEEALGKILAKKIENKWLNRNLLTRIFNLFKQIFSKFDESRIQQLTYECDKGLNVLTEDILNGKYKNLQTTDLGHNKLYKISQLLEKDKTKWDNIYETLLKTDIIYKKRRKELGLTSEEEEDELLNDQYDTLEQLDVMAHHDWQSEPFYDVRDSGGNTIERKSQNQYKIDTALSLMKLAVENTEKIKETVAQLKEQIENGTYKGNLNSACAKVRAIMDYIEAYENLLEHFDTLLDTELADPELNNISGIEQIRKDLKESAAVLGNNLRSIRKEVLGQTSSPKKINTNIKDRYKNYTPPLAIKVFTEAFKQFFTEDEVLAFGSNIKGEIMTVEEMLVFANEDLLGISAFVNSMANTPDSMLRMYDAVVKKQKEEARQECLEIQRTIMAAGKKLEKFGFGAREHLWMYERYSKDVIDHKGNIVHYAGDLVVDSDGMPIYLKSYDEETARRELEAYRAKLKADKSLTPDEKVKLYYDYINERFDKRRGQYLPKTSYYPSKAYNELTDAQKEFYNTFMDCKRRLDKYLPIFTNDSHKAIVVRKNALQRLYSLAKLNKTEFDVSTKDIKSQVTSIAGNVKDWFSELFTPKETDEEFGMTSRLTNISGQEIKRIPIYHTQKRAGTPLYNYSHNLVGNLCVYADTATKYKAMAKVIETLELGHDIMEYRLTAKRAGLKTIITNIKDGKRIFTEPITCDGKETYWSKRLTNYLDMQVYGKTKTLKSKPVELFSRFVGLMTTAVSAYVGLTNILQGLGQINIEMFAGEHFNTKDLLRAKAYYWSHILPFLSEAAHHETSATLDSFKMLGTNEMTLFSEDFNMMQEFSKSLRELQNYEKNPIARMTGQGYFYILNHLGEHYMQHVSFFALLNHEKIIDSNGKYVSILDAYEKVPIDEDNPGLGYKLALKKYKTKNGESQTYKTKDGRTIVTMEQLKARQASMKAKGKDVDLYSKSLLWNENEIPEYEFKGRLTRKGAKINQDMHGIYNEDDKNMLQQKAWGNLIMMYRKHIVPNYMKRFKGASYDYDLGVNTYGYTREMPKLFLDFFRASLKDVTDDEGNISQVKMWAVRTWSKQDKANFLRNLGQLSNWLSINLLLSLFETSMDDDDDDNWWKKILLISLYRAKTENSQFEPLALFSKHSILDEWVRLLEQPIVGTNILKNFIELFRLVSDWSVYEHKMEKPSPYAGHTEAYKIIHQCFPIYRQFEQHKDPDRLLKFYRKDVGTSKIADKLVGDLVSDGWDMDSDWISESWTNS